MVDYRDLKLSEKNIDVYYPLKQKVALISKVSKTHFKGNFLDVGCGRKPYKAIIEENAVIDSYIGLDIENPTYQMEIKPEVYWDGVSIPLENNSFESAMLIEVLEHVPDPAVVLKEVHRVLAPGGKVLITIPFLWTLHDVPHDEYRYTPFALKRLVEAAGFAINEMEAFGSWDASMASMLALYVRRGLAGAQKEWMTKFMMPVIKYLYKRDKKAKLDSFHESEMITGLWCVAEVKHEPS